MNFSIYEGQGLGKVRDVEEFKNSFVVPSSACSCRSFVFAAGRSEAQSELQQSRSEAREARTQLTLLQRERDDFAQLALERGRNIQVN